MSDQVFEPRFETLLRNALKAEAASLPLRVSPDQIMDRARTRQSARLGWHPLERTRVYRLGFALTSAAVVVIVAAVALNFYANQSRIGGLPTPSPSPSTTQSPTATNPGNSNKPTSGGMWPQSTLDEVRQGQELADAGDPGYTWQVDPRLISKPVSDPMESDAELVGYLASPGTEIAKRFLRDELGWQESLFNRFASAPVNQYGLSGLVYLRCAPGETNPLYPTAPTGFPPTGERCGPTIDELTYEAVRLDVSQPDRRGVDGIWVVSQWATTEFAQADPTVVEANATARLEQWLQARIDGDGAEGYVEVFSLFGGSKNVPLLYATSTGAPYERFEIERASEPSWPYGDMDFTVRLFAEGGAAVVEQLIGLRKLDEVIGELSEYEFPDRQVLRYQSGQEINQ